MEPSVITEFTPIASLLGGVMIGLSAVLVMIVFGRITGVAGITTAGLLMPASDWLWRVTFILGLVFAPWGMQKAGQSQWGVDYLQGLSVSDNMIGMALAGLAVGIGTVLGSGCTSGHGVCGLGRLSRRSLVAVVIFMATAALTVAVIRHV